MMSDGLEDTAPRFADVANDVKARGVILYARAYSFELEENFVLPDAVGGSGSFSIPFAPNDTLEMDPEDEEFRNVENFQTVSPGRPCAGTASWSLSR